MRVLPRVKFLAWNLAIIMKMTQLPMNSVQALVKACKVGCSRPYLPTLLSLRGFFRSHLCWYHQRLRRCKGSQNPTLAIPEIRYEFEFWKPNMKLHIFQIQTWFVETVFTLASKSVWHVVRHIWHSSKSFLDLLVIVLIHELSGL